jgi:hypothetical protein
MRIIATEKYIGHNILVEVLEPEKYAANQYVTVRAVQGEPFRAFDTKGKLFMTAINKTFKMLLRDVQYIDEDCTCITGYELTACPVCIANAPALELVY